MKKIMRGRILTVTLWMVALSFFVACHDDDHEDKEYAPGKSVVAAFEAKFPNAVAASWEKRESMRKWNSARMDRRLMLGLIKPDNG